MAEDWIDGPPPTDRYGCFPVGVLLDVIPGDVPVVDGLVLVGHVNENDGVCDDCRSGIRPEDVKRHRFVWQPSGDGDKDD